ncbi:poly(A)-specific ribonuclease PNLDC1-like [Mustelus asterias]
MTVWSLHTLPVSAWVSSGCSGFLPQSKDVRVRWISREFQSLQIHNLFALHSALESRLVDLAQHGPSMKHITGCEKYAEGGYPHEAGFDAFVCGTVLLQLAQLLLTNQRR